MSKLFSLKCDANRSLAYLIALGLSMLQVGLMFPPSFLAGHGAFFFDGDMAKDVAGWLFYAADHWRFPLLHTERMNHPQGLSIAFTDSIPLAALVFKPLAAWLPPHYHYLGLWHGLAFVLQGLGAAFLIRSLGSRGMLATIAAVLFALNWPVLLLRLGHTALLTQGLLLFALGVYFRAHAGTWSTRRAWWILLALCLAALAIHPYLMAMCYAIMLAFLLSQGLRDGGWHWQAARLAAALGLTAAWAGLLGFYGTGLGTGAYGEYRMALDAPWCDDGYSLWACPKGGGYESYNYLGLGTLLLIALALLSARPRRLIQTLRQHAGLVSIMVLLTLFAVTHRVHFGPQLIASWPLPVVVQDAAGIFQASGRFFWPVGYLLLFAALAAILRSQRAWASLAVVLAVAAQLYDTQGRRDEFRARVSMPGGDLRPGPAWSQALAGIGHVAVFPPFGCGTMDAFAYLPLQYLAAVHGATFSTAYAARGAGAACSTKVADLEHVESGTLLVSSAQAPVAELPAPFRHAHAAGMCTTITVNPTVWGVPRPSELRVCRSFLSYTATSP